jgi:hypothetical protein
MKIQTIIILLLLLASHSFSQMLPLSEQELISTSENIVKGKVLSSNAKWVNNDQYIYTFTKIIVDESYTGDFNPKDTITIVVPGGYDSIRDIGMRVSDQALFVKNEEAFVFLNKAEGKLDNIDYTFLKNDSTIPPKTMRINGYFQGKRTITTDQKTGLKMVNKPNENRKIELKTHNIELSQEISSIKK